MATTSGVAPHKAFLNASGGSWPIEHGNVVQLKVRETSTYDVEIPMDFPGAGEAFSSGLNTPNASVTAIGPGGSGELISGPISSVKMDLIARSINVHGGDGSAKLFQTTTSQKWVNQTSASITAGLVAQVGLGFSAQGLSGLFAGTKVEDDWVKLADNRSPAYIIHKLSEFEGASWWVKNGVFHMAAIGSTATGGFSIHYDPGPPVVSDCMLLIVTYNVFAGCTQSCTVKSWNPHMKKINKGVATKGGRLGSLSSTLHVPNYDQSHAQQLASARVAEAAIHALTVEATCVGDPSIDIGQGLTLSGTGVFDDSYEIHRITHTFGYEGYTMDILAKTKSTQGQSGGNWESSELQTPDTGGP